MEHGLFCITGQRRPSASVLLIPATQVLRGTIVSRGYREPWCNADQARADEHIILNSNPVSKSSIAYQPAGNRRDWRGNPLRLAKDSRKDCSKKPGTDAEQRFNVAPSKNKKSRLLQSGLRIDTKYLYLVV